MGMKAISMTMEQISWILADAGVPICGNMRRGGQVMDKFTSAKSNFLQNAMSVVVFSSNWCLDC